MVAAISASLTLIFLRLYDCHFIFLHSFYHSHYLWLHHSFTCFTPGLKFTFLQTLPIVHPLFPLGMTSRTLCYRFFWHIHFLYCFFSILEFHTVDYKLVFINFQAHVKRSSYSIAALLEKVFCVKITGFWPTADWQCLWLLCSRHQNWH